MTVDQDTYLKGNTGNETANGFCIQTMVFYLPHTIIITRFMK